MKMLFFDIINMKKRTGSIYKEPHDHGSKRRNESGNRCSRKLVKGVGMVNVHGYRWVAEIWFNGKRYRKRSANLDVVQKWLEEMKELFKE